MGFDLGMLKEGLTNLGLAVSLYKQIKDSLPRGSKKDEADEALQKAERQLKIAESQVAQGLGYRLCKNHFPPQVMLSPDERNWKCPECGNERHPSPPLQAPRYGFQRGIIEDKRF
jgi:hypothetical protein